jgi:hypothetical protein
VLTCTYIHTYAYTHTHIHIHACTYKYTHTLSYLDEGFLAQDAEHFVSDLTNDAGARVVVFVHSVTEAHETHLRAYHVCVCVCERVCERVCVCVIMKYITNNVVISSHTFTSPHYTTLPPCA